jgi:hypothetical protein
MTQLLREADEVRSMCPYPGALPLGALLMWTH